MSLLDGLFACYEWREGEGRRSLELAGNGLATFGSVLPVWATGPGLVGGALSFSGSSLNQVVSTGLNPKLADFTAAVWFYPTGAASANGAVGADRLVDKVYTTGFWVGRGVNYGAAGQNRWGGGVNVNANNAGSYAGNYGLNLILPTTNVWHQLVLRVRGLMQDVIADGGAQIASTPLTANCSADTNTICVGSASAGGGAPCNVPVAQVCLWRRGLSDQDIEQHYNNGQGLPYPFNIRRMGRPLGSRIIVP